MSLNFATTRGCGEKKIVNYASVTTKIMREEDENYYFDSFNAERLESIVSEFILKPPVLNLEGAN